MKRLIHSKLSGVIASFQLTANTAVMDMCLFIFIFLCKVVEVQSRRNSSKSCTDLHRICNWNDTKQTVLA